MSESNITFVAALFALTLGRILGKRRAYWFTMASITLYILLVSSDAGPLNASRSI